MASIRPSRTPRCSRRARMPQRKWADHCHLPPGEGWSAWPQHCLCWRCSKDRQAAFPHLRTSRWKTLRERLAETRAVVDAAQGYRPIERALLALPGNGPSERCSLLVPERSDQVSNAMALKCLAGIDIQGEPGANQFVLFGRLTPRDTPLCTNPSNPL